MLAELKNIAVTYACDTAAGQIEMSLCIGRWSARAARLYAQAHDDVLEKALTDALEAQRRQHDLGEAALRKEMYRVAHEMTAVIDGLHRRIEALEAAAEPARQVQLRRVQ